MNRKEELTRQFRALRGELNAITQAEDAAHNVLDHRLDASNACGQSGGSDGSA